MPTKVFSEAELHYEVSGLGPPVVLLHGIGENTFSWWQQVPVLARAHTVVNVDLPGFGRSRWLQEGPTDPTIWRRLSESAVNTPGIAEQIGSERRARDRREFASVVLELMDHLGFEVSVVAGHGIGGRIALRIADSRPERTVGAVAIASNGGIAPQDFAQARLIDASFLSLIEAAWKINNSGDSYLAALGARACTERPDLHQLYAGMWRLNPPLDPGLVVSAAGPMLADPGRVAVPVLFVVGDEDEVLPLSVVRGAAPQIPGARLELVDAAGHSPHFQRAGRFNRIFDAFLESVFPL